MSHFNHLITTGGNSYSIIHFCYHTKFYWIAQNITYSKTSLLCLVSFPHLIHQNQNYVYPLHPDSQLSVSVSINGTNSNPVTLAKNIHVIWLQLSCLPPDIKFLSQSCELTSKRYPTINCISLPSWPNSRLIYQHSHLPKC